MDLVRVCKWLLATLFIGSGAASASTLTKSDFASARWLTREGRIVVQARLQASGQAKLDEDAKAHVDQTTIAVAGSTLHLKRRVAIRDGRIEFGPLSMEVAKQIVNQINRRI